MTRAAERPLTIVRVITRLNIGGPARQAIALCADLPEIGFRSVLVSGVPDHAEGDLGPLAQRAGIVRQLIPELRRSIHPVRDAVALVKLARILWRERPRIIHTHMAKAGLLGRVAAWLYNRVGPGRRGTRIILVHTFHGHVLDGYFAPGITSVFVIIERWLARRTDRLIAVSPAIRKQLLEKGIGRPAQWRVIPLGLDLSALEGIPPAAQGAAIAIGVVGRLVPIKNPALFLEAMARMAKTQSRLRGVLIGDGPLRAPLQRQAAQLGLSQTVQFTGWQDDLRTAYAGLDIACLTSWNEGTPVALIEAMAAGRPIVATDVGGVRDLLDSDGRFAARIAPGTCQVTGQGVLINPGDVQGLIKALTLLADDAALRQRLGEAARRHVTQRYSQARLVRDLAALYEELCAGGRE